MQDLAYGSKGPEVLQLQKNLNTLGFNCGTADGIFGGLTLGAVKRYQQARGLVPDGIAGQKTQGSILRDLSSGQSSSSNGDVLKIQTTLKDKGFDPGPLDGIPGPRTINAIKAFQRANGLVQDGIVGPITSKALFGQNESVQPTPATGQIKQIPFTNHLDQVGNRSQTKFIVQHHVDGDLDFQQTNAVHLNKGWACIGYHFFVDFDGSVIQGRPMEKIPAAVYGLNDCSVNIVVRGNCETKAPTDEQLKAIEWLVPYIRGIYPNTKYIGHKEAIQYSSYATSTDCPGKYFPLEEIKNKFN